ncbi:hypothetical protein Q3G72_025026 [Acer saccharum]|nr:hypothetical protein Q3G72_025026 [Acer saccharum]
MLIIFGFISVNQFYSKLGEKHQALEAERRQCEARQKEEREAAIKQLRKNMVIKANPIPSFYYEEPPPKAECKKVRYDIFLLEQSFEVFLNFTAAYAKQTKVPQENIPNATAEKEFYQATHLGNTG